MRRAVRDYKYEVNEGRMTDECIQYLTQLQKEHFLGYTKLTPL